MLKIWSLMVILVSLAILGWFREVRQLWRHTRIRMCFCLFCFRLRWDSLLFIKELIHLFTFSRTFLYFYHYAYVLLCDRLSKHLFFWLRHNISSAADWTSSATTVGCEINEGRLVPHKEQCGVLRPLHRRQLCGTRRSRNLFASATKARCCSNSISGAAADGQQSEDICWPQLAGWGKVLFRFCTYNVITMADAIQTASFARSRVYSHSR